MNDSSSAKLKQIHFDYGYDTFSHTAKVKKTLAAVTFPEEWSITSTVTVSYHCGGGSVYVRVRDL